MYTHLDYFDVRFLFDGMLAMMACFALTSFLQQKRRVYLLYGLYTLFLLLNLWANDYKCLFSSSRDERLYALFLENLFQSFSLFFYFWFATDLLNLAETDPFSERLTIWARWLLGIEIALDTVLWFLNTEHHVRYNLYMVDRYAVGALAIWAISRLIRSPDPVRVYFLLGTCCFLFGALYAVSAYVLPGHFAHDPNRPFTNSLANMQLGAVLEVLFFTLGLSRRNQQIEQEKIAYQAQLIEQLRENEAKQARLNGLRDEIARDLHDEMGSQLSSISILSETLALHEATGGTQQRLRTIGQTAQQVMESMREIVWSLHSSGDSLQNVGVRIRETATDFFGDSSTSLTLSLPDTDEPLGLTGQQRRELFLIAKECLHNTYRHAAARHVRVELHREAKQLVLQVLDDGRGFDLTTKRSGLGLSSLRLRADRLGADLVIDTKPEQGTSVRLVCPLKTAIARDMLPELPLPNARATSHKYA